MIPWGGGVWIEILLFGISVLKVFWGLAVFFACESAGSTLDTPSPQRTRRSPLTPRGTGKRKRGRVEDDASEFVLPTE